MTGLFKFIGQDEHLQHSEVYALIIQSSNFAGGLVARIDELPGTNISSYPIWQCPYDNYKMFAENWLQVQ